MLHSPPLALDPDWRRDAPAVFLNGLLQPELSGSGEKAVETKQKGSGKRGSGGRVAVPGDRPRTASLCDRGPSLGLVGRRVGTGLGRAVGYCNAQCIRLDGHTE